MQPIPKRIENVVSAETLATVLRYIEEVKHGTVTLIIQDGKVVQVDKLEKIRVR
ncbi:MAG: YezD family protein [Clostridiales bacterium]|jgi:hypothetical protein|nr:YezD family protein [Clostridiales bacterium]